MNKCFGLASDVYAPVVMAAAQKCRRAYVYSGERRWNPRTGLGESMATNLAGLLDDSAAGSTCQPDQPSFLEAQLG